ncbi:hypothetical protein [Bacillus litorisediminis]|uniref:hypothetical protein n=1 Tax=Bacillus litorisediminis TaxID=2922713 RepID=UPI001FAF2098|nr:hypothetical protein [Bacillus litorisediminis]
MIVLLRLLVPLVQGYGATTIKEVPDTYYMFVRFVYDKLFVMKYRYVAGIFM